MIRPIKPREITGHFGGKTPSHYFSLIKSFHLFFFFILNRSPISLIEFISRFLRRMSSSEAKSLLPFRSKDSASKSSQSSSSDPKTPQLSRTLRQKKQDNDRTVHTKSVRRKIAIPSEAESTSEELVKLPEKYIFLCVFVLWVLACKSVMVCFVWH